MEAPDLSELFLSTIERTREAIAVMPDSAEKAVALELKDALLVLSAQLIDQRVEISRLRRENEKLVNKKRNLMEKIFDSQVVPASFGAMAMIASTRIFKKK